MSTSTYKKIAWFLWFLLGVIFIILNLKHPLNGDEGMILGGSWRLLHGDRLYKDFFEFIPPGSFYFIWGVWKVFGPFYWVARLVSAVLIFLGGVGLYKICRESCHVNRYLWCFLPVFLFFIFSSLRPLINHNAFNIVFVIWAVYFYLQGLERKKKSFFVWSGLFTGVSILFLQHRGGALLIAGIVFLTILIIKNKEWRWSYLGYYSGFSVLPLFTLLKWSPSTIFNNLFMFPLFGYLEVNQISFQWFLLSLFWFISLLLVVSRQLSLTRKFLFLTFFLLLVSILSRPDLWHLSLIFPFLGVIIVSFRDDFFSQNFLVKGVLLVEVCFLLGMGELFLCMTSTFYTVKNSEFFSYVNKHCPEEHIYAGPFLPGVYFETGKHNPTFFPPIPELNKDRAKLNQIRNDLVETNPQCIILDYSMVNKYDYNRDNLLDNWIMKNYKKTFGDSGGIMVFQRRH